MSMEQRSGGGSEQLNARPGAEADWNTLKGDVGEIADAAVERGRHFIDSAREQASGYVDRRKDDVARSVTDLADSLREATRSFDDRPNIRAFVMSHSKPFGGYYHRVGGVFARTERPSLFGNRWFKNLLSLAWGTEMMRRHTVHELPRKYRPVQEEAARRVGAALGIELAPADVNLLATAPWRDGLPQPLVSVGRALDMELVFEGVETAADADSLRAFGGRTGQGWLFGKAMAPVEAVDWLRRHMARIRAVA